MASVWNLPFKELPEDVQEEIKKLPDMMKYLELIRDEVNPMPLSKLYHDRVFDPFFRETHLPLLVTLLPYLGKKWVWRIFSVPVSGNGVTNFREVILDHFLQRNTNLTREELKSIGSNVRTKNELVPRVLEKLTDKNLQELAVPAKWDYTLPDAEEKEWAETLIIFRTFMRNRTRENESARAD